MGSESLSSSFSSLSTILSTTPPVHHSDMRPRSDGEMSRPCQPLSAPTTIPYSPELRSHSLFHRPAGKPVRDMLPTLSFKTTRPDYHTQPTHGGPPTTVQHVTTAPAFGEPPELHLTPQQSHHAAVCRQPAAHQPPNSPTSSALSSPVTHANPAAIPLGAPPVFQPRRDIPVDAAVAAEPSSKRVCCNLCGKSFAGMSSHNRHVSRTHERARPFACDLCPATFGQKGSLDRHRAAVHLKRRPHVCELCGKGFGRADNLRIHVKTVHLKSKPFKCQTCGKAFGGKRPLAVHEATVHQRQKPLECPLCCKRFGQRSNLNAHLRQVHKQEPRSMTTAPGHQPTFTQERAWQYAGVPIPQVPSPSSSSSPGAPPQGLASVHRPHSAMPITSLLQ